MGVAGCGQSEQCLKHPLRMSRGEQVGAARDQRDALLRIIDHDREVIGCRRLLASEDNVAEQERIDIDRPKLASVSPFLK